MSTSNSLAHELEEMEDQRDALDAMLAHILTANEENLPWSMFKRLSAGANPVRVWREYRGLSRLELSRATAISESDLAAIEDGLVEPSLRVTAVIAKALRIDMEHLVPCEQA